VVLAVLAVAIVLFVLAAAVVAAVVAELAVAAVVELASASMLVPPALDEEEVRCCCPSGDEILLNIDAASAHGLKDGDAGFSFIVFWCRREGSSRDDTQRLLGERDETRQ
jgi:hypothetical protein